MRLIDLPAPGRFAGSATLRKDIVRAIDFAQRASWRGSSDTTPEIVLSLEVCFRAALDELAKLHKGSEAPQELTGDDQSQSEPQGGTDVPEENETPQKAVQSVSEVVHKENTPALPSILRKRKTK